MRRTLLTFTLAVACANVFADAIDVDIDDVRRAYPMPNSTEIGRALEQMRPSVDQALSTAPAPAQRMPAVPLRGQAVPDVQSNGQATALTPVTPLRPPPGQDLLDPKVLAAQAETARRLDPGMLARTTKLSSARFPVDNEAFLFVSLSIPAKKLRDLMNYAADYKIAVIFRGGADDNDLSLRKLGQQLRALGLRKKVNLQVYSTLFKRFKITHVPTYVLAKVPESYKEAADGSVPEDSYMKLSGDVHPEFFMRRVEEQGDPVFAEVAGRYLKMGDER